MTSFSKILKYTHPVQILTARTHILLDLSFRYFFKVFFRPFHPIYVNTINYLFKIP